MNHTIEFTNEHGTRLVLKVYDERLACKSIDVNNIKVPTFEGTVQILGCGYRDATEADLRAAGFVKLIERPMDEQINGIPVQSYVQATPTCDALRKKIETLIRERDAARETTRDLIKDLQYELNEQRARLNANNSARDWAEVCKAILRRNSNLSHFEAINRANELHRENTQLQSENETLKARIGELERRATVPEKWAKAIEYARLKGDQCDGLSNAGFNIMMAIEAKSKDHAVSCVAIAAGRLLNWLYAELAKEGGA